MTDLRRIFTAVLLGYCPFVAAQTQPSVDQTLAYINAALSENAYTSSAYWVWEAIQYDAARAEIAVVRTSSDRSNNWTRTSNATLLDVKSIRTGLGDRGNAYAAITCVKHANCVRVAGPGVPAGFGPILELHVRDAETARRVGNALVNLIVQAHDAATQRRDTNDPFAVGPLK